MNVFNETVKFGKDVIHGAWDTITVAPFKFGMFLENWSGLAGKEKQLEIRLIYTVGWMVPFYTYSTRGRN